MEWKDPKTTLNYSNISQSGLRVVLLLPLGQDDADDYGHAGYVWPGVVGAHGDTEVLIPQASFWPLELILCVCVCVWQMVGDRTDQLVTTSSSSHQWNTWVEMAGKIVVSSLSVAGAGIGLFVYLLSSVECRNKSSCTLGKEFHMASTRAKSKTLPGENAACPDQFITYFPSTSSST